MFHLGLKIFPNLFLSTKSLCAQFDTDTHLKHIDETEIVTEF